MQIKKKKRLGVRISFRRKYKDIKCKFEKEIKFGERIFI